MSDKLFMSFGERGNNMTELGFIIFFALLILLVVIVAVVVTVASVAGASAAIANDISEENDAN